MGLGEFVSLSLGHINYASWILPYPPAVVNDPREHLWLRWIYDCIWLYETSASKQIAVATWISWIASCRRISVAESLFPSHAHNLRPKSCREQQQTIAATESFTQNDEPYNALRERVGFPWAQEPTPIRIEHVSNLLHRWCAWRGRRCRSLQAALVKEPIPQVSPDPQYYAADKLFINWRTKNIKIPVKIQPSLWYRALYWNDHTILTSLTDIWIRAYSPRAGWQEALAQPKNITSSPQAFLVTPGTAAGLTVLLVCCCKFYTNHHTALISMWVCIWYSQAEAALQALVQATLLPTIQHITDQQDLQKDIWY